MIKTNLFLSTTLATALAASPVFASSSEKDDDRPYNKERYMEHYKQRHQMNMDMMEMLSETMSILRDLNHKPSAEEKQQLDDMIKQLKQMMDEHRKMAEDTMDRMHKRMMDGEGPHGMRWEERDDDR